MIALALAAALAIAPTSRPTRVYLPALVSVPRWMTNTAAPPRTATAALPTAVTDWRRLERNLMTPGAVVVLAPGEYRPSRVLHMAPGVRLEAAGARLMDRGLYLHKAHGSTVRGLTVSQVTGDGVQVSGSRDVLIDRVHVSRAGDGGLDIVEAPDDGRLTWVTVKDSTIADTKKGALLGDQGEPQDAMLRVRLIRVRFVRVGERSPKVQRAVVWMEDCRVEAWGGTAVDARLGALIHVSGTAFLAGKGSAAHLQTSFGGRIIEGPGNSYTPWDGAQ